MERVLLQELADLVGGRLVGPMVSHVRDALPLQDAVDGCITMMDSEKQVGLVNASSASAVVAGHAYSGCTKTMLVVQNIHSAFQAIIIRLRPASATLHLDVSSTAMHIDPTACVDVTSQIGTGSRIDQYSVIGANCRIGQRCWVHSGVTLMEGCQLGDDCEVFPGTVFYRHTRLGNRVTVHANVTLGAYGFGYRQVEGRHVRAAQLGWVEIDDDVEIGANSTVDRGTYGPTRIGAGTKLDKMVQIGHNCHIGRHNLICSQTGIAGSCRTGDYVVMGGKVGIADHVEIADRATLAAGSGVMRNIPEGEVVLGRPAGPIKQKMQEWAVLPRVPEMRKELHELIRRASQFEAQLKDSDSSNCQVRKDVA